MPKKCRLCGTELYATDNGDWIDFYGYVECEDAPYVQGNKIVPLHTPVAENGENNG